MENTEREFWQKAMSLVSNAKDHQEILEIVFKQLKQVSEQSQRIQQLEGERKELVEALRERRERQIAFQKTINIPPGWIQKEIDFLQSLLSKFVPNT